MVIQYGYLYVTTGWVKSGGVWARGDALYYAMNMDHFYRFEGITQWFSAYLGTNVFRVMTYVTHYWENLSCPGVGGHVAALSLAPRGRSLGSRGRCESDSNAGFVASLGGCVDHHRADLPQERSLLVQSGQKGNETMPNYAPRGDRVGWGLVLPAALLVILLIARWAPTLNLACSKKKVRRGCR